MANDLEPTHRMSYPTLLAVQPTSSELMTCRDAATRAGLLLRSVEPSEAWEVARRQMVIAIMMPERLDRRDAARLTSIARATGAVLVPMRRGAAAEEIEALLEAAVRARAA